MIKVLLVDDHLIVLRGLQFYLEKQEQIRIVGLALHGEEALQLIEQELPDVVLMDIQMPVMDGIEATKRITARYPQVKVIILTSFSDQDSIIPAIRSGAVGYQLKDVKPQVLADTIFAVMKGNQVFHPEVTNKLILQVHESDHDYLKPDILTPKEREVLYHITLGQSNKEIAASLSITEKTVKTHVSSILGKMGLQDRTQAAVYAIRHDWFD